MRPPGCSIIARLGDFLRRIKGRIRYKALDRVTPLAVPVLLEIGQELVYGGGVADAILREAADDLVREAMQRGSDACGELRPRDAASAGGRAVASALALRASRWSPTAPARSTGRPSRRCWSRTCTWRRARPTRERGTLLPPYDTRETLARLAAVIDRYEPARVIALGDSFHDDRRRRAHRRGRS